MSRFFTRIFEFFDRRKPLLALIMCVIVIVCAALIARIDFSEDISGFLPNEKDNQQADFALQNISAANTIMVYFSCADSTDDPTLLLPEAIDSFAEVLESTSIGQYTKRIQYTIDETAILEKMDFIVDNMPYFLDQEDYLRFDTILTDEKIAEQLEYNKKMLGSMYGSMMKHIMAKDPLFLSGNLLAGLSGFKMNDNFKLEDGYLYSKDGQEAIVIIESKFPVSETANNKTLIEIIDQAVHDTEQSLLGNVKIVPFGAAYVSVGNAQQIKTDSFVTIAIALILIVLILIYSFKSLRIIMALPLAIGFGMIFALAVTSAIFHQVSLIAVGISSVIIGIAANYPLHFLDHKYHGFSTRQTLADIVSPLTIGNITTVGAFLSLLFISAPAMKNLGVFASMLLVGTILFVLVILPIIVPENNKHYSHNPKRLFERLSDSPLEKNRWIVLGVCIITIAFLFLDKAGFDADMSKINYMTPQHRRLMSKLITDTETNEKTLYIAAEATTMDQALENYESIKDSLRILAQNDSTIRLISIGNFLPSQHCQQRRIALWNKYFEDKDIYTLVNKIGQDVGFRDGAFVEFNDILHKEFTVEDNEYFAPLTGNLADNYLIDTENRCMVLSLLMTEKDHYEHHKERLRQLPYLNAEGVVIFSQDSMMSHIVSALSDDFDFVLLLCSVIVFFFLWFSFGRLELAIIAFIPLAISWIWILAIMQLVGIQFNIVSIILATFIFGMGDDYTIFITEGCLYEHRYGRKMLKTYKNTIILSAIIMFVGIGSLVLAKHPAMKQLGIIVIIGMFVVVTMAFIIPPFFYRYLTTKKNLIRKEPITLRNLLATIWSFTFFLLGSLYITLTGFVLLTLGKRNAKNKLRYHKTIQRVSGFALRNIPFTRLRTEGFDATTFEKPSILISNHQAHIDLMAILMLSPKIIVITNKWVWNFPIYGKLIRYADFCPIDNFLSDDLSHIEAMIQEGYSVAIFPEGTRSPDGTIGRFHKGAFLLAEKYNLDITAVMLHGFTHVLPKDDLLLREGRLTIRKLPTIAANDIVFGSCYQEKSKAIRKMYVEEYKKMSDKIEDVDYYAYSVIHNYIYKGKDIERNVRKELKDNRNYRDLVDRIPLQGSVLLENVGMGVPSLIAASVRKNTYITAIIEDEDLFLTANNCAGKPNNLLYIREINDTTYDIKINCHG